MCLLVQPPIPRNPQAEEYERQRQYRLMFPPDGSSIQFLLPLLRRMLGLNFIPFNEPEPEPTRENYSGVFVPVFRRLNRASTLYDQIFVIPRTYPPSQNFIRSRWMQQMDDALTSISRQEKIESNLIICRLLTDWELKLFKVVSNKKRVLLLCWK